MQPERKVKQERSGWRDRDISKRHREWGFNCPATDVDFLEYDQGRGVALCEWKHERAKMYDSEKDVNIKALRNLANSAKIPFFVIIRANDLSWFDVYPENKTAKETMTRGGLDDHCFRATSELDFVQFLYWLRGRVVPDAIANYIETNKFVPRVYSKIAQED